MSSYHTQALADADIFTIMGSIYAEVARYDSAIEDGHIDAAFQAVKRAEELADFTCRLKQLNKAQKLEIMQVMSVFAQRTKAAQKSGLDGYLLPFAVAARMRQLA